MYICNVTTSQANDISHHPRLHINLTLDLHTTNESDVMQNSTKVEDTNYKPLKANKSCLCASSHSSFALDIKLSSSLSIVRVLQQ